MPPGNHSLAIFFSTKNIPLAASKYLYLPNKSKSPALAA